jgi:hypothetical protein
VLVFIGRDGIIRKVDNGPTTENQFARDLEGILAPPP